MSSNTNTPLKNVLQSLYDALMREVEPELTSDIFDDVELYYVDETPEERQERMEHYQEAIRIVGERFEAIVGIWREQLLETKKKFLKQQEKRQSNDDASHSQSLESQFNLQ